MATTTSFIELLTTELRWPRDVDKPFVASGKLDVNARIADRNHTRLVLMTAGYKKAADIMVDASEVDWRDRDLLVFPIIFSYRQFLELSLKYQLATFGQEVEIKPNWRTHDLNKLWAEFKVMLDRYGVEDAENGDAAVAAIVSEFSKIDPGSYSYRYPVDQQGQPVPIEHYALHLRNLASVMDRVEGYFSGCDGYLASLKFAGT